MPEARRSARLLGLFAAGALLLNFPLFSIWDKDAFVLGWPLLPAAAFAIWLGLIVALALLMEWRAPPPAGPEPGAPAGPKP